MIELAPALVHFPQIVVTWTIFFGAGILIYTFYAVKTKNKVAFKDLWEHCVPFNPLTEKSFHADVKIYIISKLTDGFFLIPVVAAQALLCTFLSQILKSTFPDLHSIEFGILAASISTIIMFIFVEFSDFITHYAEHKIPFLWEFHKVHHSAQVLNPLTSKRGHPVDAFVTGFSRAMITSLPAGVCMFLFGLSVMEAISLSMVASKIFVIATLDPLKHSHHPISLGPFDRLLISPHMHQIHHSKVKAHWDKNFGTNLSVFDWLFKVAYRPAKGETAVYGIAGLSDATLRNYNTMRGAYIGPIVKGYKRLKKVRGYLATVRGVPQRTNLDERSARLS